MVVLRCEYIPIACDNGYNFGSTQPLVAVLNIATTILTLTTERPIG
jgi:hypothetical protein